MKKLFLIIGAPGSGKTTDAQMIAQKHENITHYSTGDMFRAEIQSASKRGEIINSYVSKGNLVPIDIVIETIINAIKQAPSSIVIIDGYPRSQEQMIELDKYLLRQQEVILVNVIEVKVSKEIACQRVLGRAADAKIVRADDNVKVFNNRMKLFTDPLLEIQEFYTSRNLLKQIDGERSIDVIVNEMNLFIQAQIQ